MKALEILKELQCSKVYKFFCKSRVEEAIKELETLESRSCVTCKNSSFEVKFGELELNACFLVSNGNVCKWEPK